MLFIGLKRGWRGEKGARGFCFNHGAPKKKEPQNAPAYDGRVIAALEKNTFGDGVARMRRGLEGVERSFGKRGHNWNKKSLTGEAFRIPGGEKANAGGGGDASQQFDVQFMRARDWRRRR